MKELKGLSPLEFWHGYRVCTGMVLGVPPCADKTGNKAGASAKMRVGISQYEHILLQVTGVRKAKNNRLLLLAWGLRSSLVKKIAHRDALIFSPCRWVHGKRHLFMCVRWI